MEYFEKRIEQEFDSKETSIRTINRVYKNFSFKPNSLILDYGGGKYDDNALYMKKLGNTVLVYDPYNRTKKHNDTVKQYISANKLDYIVCSNVLNVIKEDAVIYELLSDIKNIGINTVKVFTVYEGNKSGIGCKTKKGYQRNLKYTCYLPMLSSYFKIIEIKSGIIVCM